MPDIRRLSPADDLSGFVSARPTLDDWLRRFALQAMSSNSATTYVHVENGEVIGFVSLASASIMPSDMDERIRKGIAKNLPAPAQLLARLATAVRHEGRGIGTALILHAMRTVLDISRMSAVRALVVNPIDDKAAEFYGKFDFQQLPGVDPPMMYLLTKDVVALVRHYDNETAKRTE